MSNFDLKANVAEFVAGLGNGKRSLVAMCALFVNIANASDGGYDGTGILRYMERAGKRGDSDAAKRVKFFAEKVFDGAKVSYNEEKNAASCKMKGCKLNLEALTKLESFASAGHTLRDDTVRRAFAVKRLYDIAALKRAALKARAEGYSDDQIAMAVAEALADAE